MDNIERQIMLADITHHKFKAVVLAAAAPELMVDVLAGCPLPMVYFDFRGTFTMVNRKFADMVGMDPIDLDGQEMVSFIHPDDRTATIDAMGYSVKGVDPKGFVNRYRHSNGDYRWIYWFPQPPAQNEKYGVSFALEVKEPNVDLIAGFLDLELRASIKS